MQAVCQMSGSLCFTVSTLDDPCTLRVIDSIRHTADAVKVNKRVISYTTTDSHLFVLTEDAVLAMRLDSLKDTPLTASLDTSRPDSFMFKPDLGASVIVERTNPHEKVLGNPNVSASPVLLVSTHSRVFLIDQRGEDSQRMYRIFDASSLGGEQKVMQLQVPEGMGRVTRVRGGADHIVALTEEGRVWTMGTGSHGELGVGGVCSSPAEFVECHLPDDVIFEDVAAGAWHSVALTDSKDVYVWGWNREMQLGEYQDKCVYLPTPLDIEDVISIDASECTTVLTTEDELGYVSTVSYGFRLIRDQD